jgi:hypothetical protein
MRTTIDIDAGLLEKARERAAQEGRSVDSVVEAALRDALQELAAPRGDWRLPLFTPPKGRKGVLPGVKLDRTSELLEIMSGSDASS